MDYSFIINQLGEENVIDTEPITPPIFQTSNFRFSSVAAFRKALENEKEALIYSRGNNPNLTLLSKKIAALEHAEDCLVTASGMSAITTAIFSNVKSGDHVVCQQHPYSWAEKMMLGGFLERFNVEVSMVDGTQNNCIIDAIRHNTRLIYLESPNSWTYELQDIAFITKIAKQKGIITIIDNSYASPVNQQPLLMGIDIVVHSATKYIGGHSDTIGGLICSSRPMIEKIFNNEYLMLGGIASPFNAWLMLRGLRTLSLRMEKIADSALKIAEYLEQHPKIEKVYYPFLKSNPQYDIAKKQMKKGSGLISVLIKDKNIKSLEKFCNNLKYFNLAVSWGGFESLVFPALVSTERSKKPHLPQNLIRFSIGLEETDVLINDLENALKLV
ncbi:MAG: PLP-dependent aspartate aminotransferase family protein [Lentimicrobiaceae bacterium]|nr:PLP-dependent aspartate aminotransferase family protein [Lentimicrobiaceae bacterium]